MVSGFDVTELSATIARHGPVVRVMVAQVRGSAPRGPGAAMLVWGDGFSGTIGGGALEWQALAEARARLGTGADGLRTWPLGPGLGQCCGGTVTLAFEVLTQAPTSDAPVHARPIGPAGPMPAAIRAHARAARAGIGAPAVFAQGWLSEVIRPARTPLFLYGAGHVGRAVARVLDGLPFDVTWVDDAAARFPAQTHGAAPLVAVCLADAARLAPAGAVHMVMTYSHAFDLEICHHVLTRGDFARLGVIGSASKSARFRARLRALGHRDALIARLECPIGLPGLGKTPAEIAVALAADLLTPRSLARAYATETAI